MTERFAAFYSSRPFWAGEAIDFDTVRKAAQFTRQMSAIVFSHDTDEYRLRVCRDGMLMLQVFELEAEAETDDGEKLRPIEEKVAWWGRYLDYLNCLYLLLDSATIRVANLAYFELSEITNKDGFRVYYENGCVFHVKLPPVPAQSCHPFQAKVATPRSAAARSV